MIVDTHAHIFSANGPFVSSARYRPDYDAEIMDWLAHWRKAGVTHGVLVQPSFLGTDNRMLLAALVERPGCLRGVAVIDAAIHHQQLQQWDALGVRGIRLNLIGVSDLSAFRNAEWTRIFEWLAELGWHLEIQCEGERYAALLSMLPDIPLTLVIDHFGLPDPTSTTGCPGVSAILQMAERRPLYVKLSAPYRLRGANPAKYAALYLSTLGPKRLLWGSDWPWTNHEHGRTYEAGLEVLAGWIPSSDMRNLILCDVPKHLYGFIE